MAIIFVRTLIVYLSLTFAMRAMGKRQMGELELNELVVAVLISDLAAHPLQDIGIPLMNGLIPILTLFCCELLFSGAVMNNARLRVLLCGRPSMIVSNGVIQQKEMRKNRYTIDELTEELRKQAVMDISTVQFAVLETNGTLSVMPYPAERPVTAGQMNVQAEDSGYPSIIINDGKVMDENLRRLGRDEGWLKKELKNRKAEGAKDVYVLMLDGSGKVYYAAQEARV